MILSKMAIIGILTLSVGCTAEQKGNATDEASNKERIVFVNETIESIEEGMPTSHKTASLEDYRLNRLLTLDYSKRDNSLKGDLYFIADGEEPLLISNKVSGSQLAPRSCHIAYNCWNNELYLKRAGEKAVLLGEVAQYGGRYGFTEDEKYFYFISEKEDQPRTVHIYDIEGEITEKLRLIDPDDYAIYGEDIYYLADGELYRVIGFEKEEHLLGGIEAIRTLSEDTLVLTGRKDSQQLTTTLYDVGKKEGGKESITFCDEIETVAIGNEQMHIMVMTRSGGFKDLYFNLPGQENVLVMEGVVSMEGIKSMQYVPEERLLYFMRHDEQYKQGLYCMEIPNELPKEALHDQAAFETFVKGIKKKVLFENVYSFDVSPNGKAVIIKESGEDDNSILRLIRGSQIDYVADNIECARVFDDHVLYYTKDSKLWIQEFNGNEPPKAPQCLSDIELYGLFEKYAVSEEGKYTVYVKEINGLPSLVRYEHGVGETVLVEDIYEYNEFRIENFYYSRNIQPKDVIGTYYSEDLKCLVEIKGDSLYDGKGQFNIYVDGRLTVQEAFTFDCSSGNMELSRPYEEDVYLSVPGGWSGSKKWKVLDTCSSVWRIESGINITVGSEGYDLLNMKKEDFERALSAGRNN